MRVGRLALLLVWLGAGSLSAQTATVNFADTKQRIDGFGAANGHQGLTEALADLFFDKDKGIGLTLFRLPFSSGGSGTYESEVPNWYLDAHMAAERGALVWAAPWTASPAAWKDNASLVQGNLSAGHYGDWATKLSQVATDLHTNASLNLYAMSVGNEPDAVVVYESMLWSAANMRDFIKNNLGPTYAALNPRPLLIAPEASSWDTSGTYLSTLAADATAYGYVDIVATHQYAGSVVAYSTSGKRVWQTEMSTLGGGCDASMTQALTFANWIYSALVTGGVNAWHAWWTRNDQANALGLIGCSSDDTLTKRLYAFGNYSKFIRPGWWRVGVSLSSVPANVNVSAFRAWNNSGIAIVVVNTSGGSVSLTGTLQGLTVASVTPYVTSSTQDLARLADVTVTAGSFTASVANNTVETFVGTTTPPSRLRRTR